MYVTKSYMIKKIHSKWRIDQVDLYVTKYKNFIDLLSDYTLKVSSFSIVSKKNTHNYLKRL